MKTTLVIVAATLFALLPSSASAGCHGLETDGGFVTMGDVPVLLHALKSTGTDGSFWVLLVPHTAFGDGLSANLQFSIQNGTLGLDWVLIAKRNIKDKDKFENMIKRSGYEYTKHEMNQVRYLRVTHVANFAKVARSILNKLYGVKPNEYLRLIITGFKWPKDLTIRCSEQP